MGLNIGFDFGSTYSMIGVLDQENGGLSCLNLNVNSPYIPSKVSYDSSMDRYDFGSAASSNIGDEDIQVFSAFKTLLNSKSDDSILAERHYDSKHTPEFISRLFINQLLRKVMKNYNTDRIDNLCIGIPEVWGRNFRYSNVEKSIGQAIGKKKIEEILKSFDYIGRTMIVTEPQAASAFFVHNYKKIQGAELDGKVLIIDYGGGTLDITLSNVSALDDGSKMQIKVIDSKGAGENYDGNVGNAGILYIESLIRLAMKDSGITNISLNSSFDELVLKVEESLRNTADRIREVFMEVDPTQKENYELLSDTFKLCRLRYEDDDGQQYRFFISYAQMYKAYMENIYPTLDTVIDRIITDTGLNIYDENLKIGLVGGFCNFYLVEMQIFRKFNISNGNDRRIAGLLSNPEDKEKAIALGASLMANDIISICDTTEYALGVYAKVNGEIFYNYGIKYRQQIEYDKVYFAKDKNDNNYIIRSVSGNLDKLLIKCDHDDKYAFDMKPKACFCAKLQNVITSKQKTAFVGFSITADGKICIHVYDCDPLTRKITGEPKKIVLTDFDNMFDPTVIC